jgi:hypothetical protein
MKHRFPPVIASTLLLLGVASGAGAATRAASTNNVQSGTCTVTFADLGTSSGSGTVVTTPSGQIIFVCRLSVENPPANTVVQTFPGTTGNIVVVTVSGRAIVVFTP